MQCYFPPSLPFPWVLFVLLAVALWLGEGFSCLWVSRGDSIPCGISAAFGNPACSSPTGLFAEQQRNCQPAGLLMRPKISAWTQPGAKNRARGCTITTSLFFTLKSHCSLGRDPGFALQLPALLAHVRYFPLAPVLASLHGWRHHQHLECSDKLTSS